MKCIALLLTAGGLLVSVPALAQEGEVSLYGNLHPFLDNFRTHGATSEGLSPETGGASQVTVDDYTGENLPNRFRITSGTSHIGFRAELKLNKQISAFMQVESAVNPDGDHPVLTSPWASRNSGVGLKGDYGTLFFGNWDTPYKHPTLFIGPLRGLNPFDNTLTGNPGFNVPGTTTQNGRASSRADAAFNRRQGNSIQYWTPKLVGLSARFAVSVNESRTRHTDFEPSISPILLSGLLSYEIGELAVHYGYERHMDYFGTNWVGGSPGATFTNPSSNDDAHEFLAWFTFPTRTRIAAIVERLTYRTDDTTAGAVDGYQRDAVYGAVQQHIGDHALWGALGVADEGRCTRVGQLPCTTNGLNGLQWSVGYTFSPAKWVDLYASYYEMRNGRSGTYALFPPVVPIAPGSTTTAFGLGIMFLFDVHWRFGAKPEPVAAPPPATEERPAATPPPRPEAAPAPDESAKEPAAEPAAPEPAAPEPAEPTPP
jgi:predicted porin